MKYKNLKEWLDGKAGEYNLIEDTQNEQDDDFEMIESPYEKFFIYKYVNSVNKCAWNSVWENMGNKGEEIKKEFEAKAEKYKSIKDPDSYSQLLQDIYSTLWGKMIKFNEKEFKDKKDKIASDSMTSVQGILKVVLQNISILDTKNDAKDVSSDMLKHIQMVCDNFKKINEKQEYWTVLFCVVAVADLSAAKLDKEFYKLMDVYYPALGEFISRCFTVGNRCPVPMGFNVPRSRKGYINYDYWDLTLMKIKDWYDKKDDSILKEQLFHNNERGNLENCKNWLGWFEKDENKVKKEYDGWHNFVDILLMQDYVNENYDVKPFWAGHTWENPELPKDDEKIKGALKEISERIAARSNRIVEELNRKEIEYH